MNETKLFCCKTYQKVYAMRAKRSDGCRADESEDEPAVFKRVWHGEDATAEAALD